LGASRSSVQQTDCHEVEEHRFAHEMTAMLDRVARALRRRFGRGGVGARFADLRKAFHPDVKKKIIAEATRISPSIQSIRSRSNWGLIPSVAFEADTSVDLLDRFCRLKNATRSSF
jgi:hypothetical protein